MNVQGKAVGVAVCRFLELPDWANIRSIEVVLRAGEIAVLRVTWVESDAKGVPIYDRQVRDVRTRQEDYPLTWGLLTDIGRAFIATTGVEEANRGAGERID